MSLIAHGLLVGLAALIAALLYRRASAARGAERARLLSRAGEIIWVESRRILPSGYECVTGRYGDLPVVLEPVADTLIVRKLPALWLMVTIPGPLPISGTVDLMMRGTGLETFSNRHELPYEVSPATGFPENASIRADAEDRGPLADALLPHLDHFRDGFGKELLVTPKGVRMVLLAAEADRASYLVFRDAKFGAAVVDPERLRGVLDTLADLRADVIALARRAEAA